MNSYEKKAYHLGFKYVAGLDEVGRGCIAGPLVVAIVIFDKNYSNSKIKDSKQLTFEQRKQIYDEIINDCIDYHIEIISPKDVDKLNPKQASRYGMKLCVDKIKTKPDYLLTDFEHVDTSIEQLNLVKGDQKSISIAAASILAKVYRDNLMIELAKKHPNYGFETHKGYLTKKHLDAIDKYGPIKSIHRFSYKPLCK